MVAMFCSKLIFYFNFKYYFMSYSWTQFFIAISLLVILYYAVVYILFFLRKAPAYNSTTGKGNSNNTVAKNTKKNNQQTNMHVAATAATLIDTKVISDDYFKTEDDFVINESINQNFVDENGVLQDNTTSIINESHTQEAIMHEVDKMSTDKIDVSKTTNEIPLPHNDDKIDLSQITISENFIREDITTYHEPHSSIVQNSEMAHTVEVRETRSSFIEENINISVANEVSIVAETLLHESKTIVANQVAEEKYFSPNTKPQQMQSLLHLVQKK
jgi:hypothetical protein